MRVLVACEFSGVVRGAFTALGHDAWSCDLLPTEIEGQHIQGDVLAILDDGWDLMIAHPPCTHLACLGAAHFHKKRQQQEDALDFVLALLNAPIPQIALENPVGVISTRIGKPTQIAQPCWFGDQQRKSLCLWLKCLPKLVPTDMVKPLLKTYPNGKTYPLWHDHYGANDKSKARRGLERSRTFPGFALAMAAQWGNARDFNYRSRVGWRRPRGLLKKPRPEPT